jgi:hypothetical protein
VALDLAVSVKAAVLVGLLLTGGQRVMRWWLTLVARRKSEELFVLNLLLVTLALAWLTELAGLSLALGAFIAGMLISETEYKHQVETDIRPFHDVLLGLFFISIGMMLDWREVAEHWPLVLLLLLVPVLIKLVLIALLARGLGASDGVALRTGLYLAQAGEFGFVLLALAQDGKLVPPQLLNPVLAAMVLSMLAAPFIIMQANAIVMRLVANEWMQQSLQMTQIARKAINTTRHVIICGYGRCGQNLARMLDKEGIAYIALDLDPDRVRQAAAAGKTLRLTYRKPGAALEERTVDPYHIGNVNGDWYLFAHDHLRKAIRTFVPSRIAEAEPTGKTFQRPAKFALERHLSDSFGVYSRSGDFEVRIRFSRAVADYIREKRWHPSQVLTELPDQGVEIHLRLGSLEEISRWILGWGAQATVLTPPELVTILRETAEALVKNYPKAPKS